MKELTMDGDLTIEEMLQMLGEAERRMRNEDSFDALAALEALVTDFDLTTEIEAA
jgi:hypothetical protein